MPAKRADWGAHRPRGGHATPGFMPHFGVPRNGMRKKFILGVGIPVFLLLLHTESHTFAYTAHTSYTYIPTYTPLNAKPQSGPVYSYTELRLFWPTAQKSRRVGPSDK